MVTVDNPLAGKTVLVADDDMDFRTVLETHLKAAGYKVLSAESQRQAEELVRGGRPDVAIVDVMMEHMDGGFALCHHIKKDAPRTPVIIVSSVTSTTGLDFDAATAEERSWVKADAMLSKPVRHEQILAVMEKLLSSEN
jgi:CheY-like chemotaxis protein